MRSLVVRADAGPTIGLGHVMRCLAIAQAWLDAGHTCRFAMAAGLEDVQARLAREGIELCRLERDQDLVKMTDEWVLLDRYGLSPDLQPMLRQTHRVAVVDDGARIGRYAADLVIDPNVFADETTYASREPHTHVLAGPMYALLRREMSRAPTRERSGAVRRVLVTMGGADVQHRSPEIANALMELDSIEIRVIVGASARPVAVEGRPRIRVVYDPPDMAEELEWADLAIAAAGGTCLELAHFGVPTLAVVTAENQRLVATHLERVGTLRSLGEVPTAGEVKRAVVELMADESDRLRMSAAGRALVDGLGAHRVASTMLEMS